MKKVFVVVAIIVIVLIVAVLVMRPKAPDLSQYQSLVNPTITQMPDQFMLVVEGKGAPDKLAMKAIPLLYKTYYSLKGTSKSFKLVAPRARWPITENTPQSQWMGLFALPLPDSSFTLPQPKAADSLKLYIAKWQYGEVAEILHKGPYDTEQETVRRLQNYIKDQGYTIIGAHEEEYLKGPGMFGPGKPDKYQTIIRYRVEKTGI